MILFLQIVAYAPDEEDLHGVEGWRLAAGVPTFSLKEFAEIPALRKLGVNMISLEHTELHVALSPAFDGTFLVNFLYWEQELMGLNGSPSLSAIRTVFESNESCKGNIGFHR